MQGKLAMKTQKCYNFLINICKGHINKKAIKTFQLFPIGTECLEYHF